MLFDSCSLLLCFPSLLFIDSRWDFALEKTIKEKQQIIIIPWRTLHLYSRLHMNQKRKNKMFFFSVVCLLLLIRDNKLIWKDKYELIYRENRLHTHIRHNKAQIYTLLHLARCLFLCFRSKPLWLNCICLQLYNRHQHLASKIQAHSDQIIPPPTHVYFTFCDADITISLWTWWFHFLQGCVTPVFTSP